MVTGPDEMDVVQTFAQIARDIEAHDTLASARIVVATLARDALGSAGTAIWHLKADARMQLDPSPIPSSWP